MTKNTKTQEREKELQKARKSEERRLNEDKLRILGTQRKYWGAIDSSPSEIDALRSSDFFYRKWYTDEYDAIKKNQDEILREVERIESIIYPAFIRDLDEGNWQSASGMSTSAEYMDVITPIPKVSLGGFSGKFIAFTSSPNVICTELYLRSKEDSLRRKINSQLPKKDRLASSSWHPKEYRREYWVNRWALSYSLKPTHGFVRWEFHTHSM